MDVDDFADAHSASITKTLNTTRSDNIETTMVFAHPASNGTIFPRLKMATHVFLFLNPGFGVYVSRDLKRMNQQ